MKRPPLEVADVVRAHGESYLAAHPVSWQQEKVLYDISVCRTAVLGGHELQCDRCGHARNSYNSCLNRHCPKCQAAARAKWVDQRAGDLLPVPYFHVVFTLPKPLRPLALQNKRLLYGILLRAAAETLREIAADPKHLGAAIGFVAVLHTWGQNLHHHPHVHCVVAGGGIAPDGSHWVRSRKKFFLPVKVLSRLFRGKFLACLRKAYQQKELSFHGALKHLAAAGQFRAFLEQITTVEWVVYAKRPFGGPRQVLKYLARYTHRVAISNRRLVSLEDGRVRFRWKDYRQGNQQREMTLDAVEFLRRFLLHLLPRGFVRIRHYGFLANRLRREKVALARRLLGAREEADHHTTPGGDEREDDKREQNELERCPICKVGRMIVCAELPREPGPMIFLLSDVPAFDTS